MEETFNIDPTDIPEQTVNIPEQAADTAVQQEHVEQVEQPIRRGRDRPSGRESETRGGNRNAEDNRDARRDARRGAPAGDASDVHMEDVDKFISGHT